MTATAQHLFIQPNWPAPPFIKAYTTLRQSGVGTPSENLNKNIGRAIDIKYPLLKQLLNLPNEPIWIKQVHGTTALKAIPENTGKEADATFTNESNQVCAILTADCLPVLICHRQGTHVAAVHAGWRGLADGVIESALQKMNLPPQELLVWLGPAIGPKKFEVKKDVYDAFISQDPEAILGFRQTSDEHWLADLYALARLRLKRYGITNVYSEDFCTYTDQERFFSYRRASENPDNDSDGRICSLIWIADSLEKL